MKFTILLTKDDIVTHKVGLHFQVSPKDSPVSINFTPEAIDELIKDIKDIRDKESVSNHEHVWSTEGMRQCTICGVDSLV